MNCVHCVSSRRRFFSHYSSVLASTLLCAVVCWGENVNAGGCRQDEQAGGVGRLCCKAESEHPGGLGTREEEDQTELHL